MAKKATTAQVPGRDRLGDSLGGLATSLRQSVSDQHVIEIPVTSIDPDPVQARRKIDKAGILSLADSIKSQGVIQPIVVIKHPKDAKRYQIRFGERRWRASVEAGQPTVKAIVANDSADDAKRLAIQLTENIHREDMSLVDIVSAVSDLVKHSSQAKAARALGKQPGWVSKVMALADSTGVIADVMASEKVSDLETMYLLSTLHKKAPAVAARLSAQWMASERVENARSAVKAAHSKLNEEAAGSASGSSNGGSAKDVGTSSDDDVASQAQSSTAGGKSEGKVKKGKKPQWLNSADVIKVDVIEEHDGYVHLLTDHGDFVFDPSLLKKVRAGE